MITFKQFCKRTRLNEGAGHHFVVADFDTSEMPPAAVQYVLDNVSDFDERYRNALDQMGDGYIESLSDADSSLFEDISTAVTEWAKADGIGTEEEDAIPFDWQAVFENPFLLDECNASKKARKGGKAKGAKKVNEKYDKENQERFFLNVYEDDDLGVVIGEVEYSGGEAPYKEGELEDSLYNFIYQCKGMEESCNGSLEISLKNGFWYNVHITDENGDLYASINFRIVYFNEQNPAIIQNVFENAG